MRISRRAAGAAVGAALALGATSAIASAPANAAAPAAPVQTASKLGTKSLVSVLTADKSGFDRNGKDFDILTAAVTAVLGAKPKSAVGVLANGKVPVTAFIPNDLAFRYLVRDLTGKNPRTEADAFKAVASLGIPTVEKVLLYHVVPGKTIDARAALKSNNAVLHTAAGVSLKVRVVGKTIFLQDKDRDARNPRVIVADINKGNRQIAHAIDRVLRPVNL
jgi:uncharacterized surface protein with fasciclin (FAS1) repeats